jgi:hypothetical protein
MEEVATFGIEMVAMRICKELIAAIHYKLRMFGVEIDGPANVFCDNRGIVKNVSILELMLMKKHNAMNYHAVREVVAASILRVGKEDGEKNLADLLTKVITGQKRWDFCYCLGLTARLYWRHVTMGITSHASQKRLEAL